MAVLINDWDDSKRRPTVRYGVKCVNCERGLVVETPGAFEGWEEAKTPNADGRTPALCPDCRN